MEIEPPEINLFFYFLFLESTLVNIGTLSTGYLFSEMMVDYLGKVKASHQD